MAWRMQPAETPGTDFPGISRRENPGGMPLVSGLLQESFFIVFTGASRYQRGSMLQLRSDQLELGMNDDGTDVVIEDRARRIRWRLDDSTRFAASRIGRFDHQPYSAEARAMADGSKVCPLGSGKAVRLDDTTIVATHQTAAGIVTLHWTIKSDCLHVTAESTADAAPALSLPGVFRPDPPGDFLAAVPHGQGLLHTGRGPAFTRPLFWRGRGYTLAMFGQIASRGALVTIAETDADAAIWWEKTAQGRIDLMWLQHPSLGKLSYPREVVIAPAAPDLTAVCKRYRRHEIGRSRFKTWDQKIAERPNLEKLFGAATIFIGYHQDPGLDYTAQLRRLKQMGIDRALVYPVYLDSIIDIQKSTGLKSIDIRDHLGLIKELDYLAGSFIYIVDGPPGAGADANRDLLLDAAGKPRVLWQIRDLTWYVLSAEKRFEWARRLLDHEHHGLHGVHYDVLCNVEAGEDYNPLHRKDGRADQANRKAMLQYAADRGLIVSSEGFWDRATPHYDLCNGTKFSAALGGAEYCVVPMTMLVYHDSAFHTWWEVDNYNNPEHCRQSGRGQTRRFALGGGNPRLQSAMDALMGTPPDLFPFGLQYSFVPHNHPQIYTYKMKIDDPALAEALEPARRVMALNRRIGKLEMIAHKLHHPSGAIQESVFADGTRVIANFANVPLEAPDMGEIPAESWRTV